MTPERRSRSPSLLTRGAGDRRPSRPQMSYRPDSLKGGIIWGIVYGRSVGVIKGVSRRVDYSSDDFISSRYT